MHGFLFRRMESRITGGPLAMKVKASLAHIRNGNGPSTLSLNTMPITDLTQEVAGGNQFGPGLK